MANRRLGRMLALAVTAVLAGVAQVAVADPLEQLRQALDRLPATTPVAGNLTVEVNSSTDGEDGSGRRAGSVTVQVDARREGVTMKVPADLLAEARREERGSAAKDGEPGRTPAAALREVTAILVDQVLDAASHVRRTLEQATFERQGAAPDRGPGARELFFRLDPPMSERERKRFKELTLTLAVTVDGDGTPVAARQLTRLRGRVLLASFELNSIEESRFAVVGDRLVAIRQRKEERGSGMGQRSESTRVLVLTVASPQTDLHSGGEHPPR